MGTALIYLVVLLVVAALFFVGASAVFGRGEELAPIPTGATPTWLPDRELGAAHVRSVRFQQAVRGYRMAEVDWVLDRLAGELERHAEESDGLRSRIVELEAAVAGAKQADVMALVSALPVGRPERDPGGPADQAAGDAQDHAAAQPTRPVVECSAEHSTEPVPDHPTDRGEPA